jgi:hypothetical protein
MANFCILFSDAEVQNKLVTTPLRTNRCLHFDHAFMFKQEHMSVI